MVEQKAGQETHPQSETREIVFSHLETVVVFAANRAAERFGWLYENTSVLHLVTKLFYKIQQDLCESISVPIPDKDWEVVELIVHDEFVRALARLGKSEQDEKSRTEYIFWGLLLIMVYRKIDLLIEQYIQVGKGKLFKSSKHLLHLAFTQVLMEQEEQYKKFVPATAAVKLQMLSELASQLDSGGDEGQ